MSRIAFIGLGKMGIPMVKNLLSSGHSINAFDLSAEAREKALGLGCNVTSDAKEAAFDCEYLITMLPAGEQIKEVYLGAKGVISAVQKGVQLIDCSTVDIESSQKVHEAALNHGLEMVDAPVSGGVVGAEKGALTFMVGGTDKGFSRVKPILLIMGNTVVHAGNAGMGQAAKICNNMLLGISMIAVSEAFVLADGLGLDRQKLFDISSNATGSCWSLNNYCPVPGPVPESPANSEYAPGFTASMMLKDLDLAKQASQVSGVKTKLGEEAETLYKSFCESGNDNKDFSGIFSMISNLKKQ